MASRFPTARPDDVAHADERPIYHRYAEETEIDLVLASGEVWGLPPRNYYRTDFPALKAFVGELPEGGFGYEFTTDVEPKYSGPWQRRWIEGMPGVIVEDGYAKIPVTVTRCVRRKVR